jgi:DNA-binding PadR family transcriptional regulator
MPKKYGCDMRGMLSFQILWLLSKRQMHGEAIAVEIEKRRGEKPKASTLYPALKELKSSGLISSRKAGKLIVYSLTQEGRSSLKRAIDYFCRSFGDVFEEEKAAGR